jgi:hypothetical protein
LLAACGGGAGAERPSSNIEGPPSQPPALPPTPGEPTPPPAEFVVRGEVFSFDTGMIAHSDINLWVQTPGFGFSYWWANGPLRSDGLGLFEAYVPKSDISLHAFKDGYVQPCAVRSQVTQDVEVRIELLPVSALNTLNAPRPQLSSEPSVTGTIFETTESGRQVIADAYLWAEDAIEVDFATTRSDLGGGFYLCNLPEGTYLDVRKTGFKPLLVGPINGTKAAVLEIEMERESE